MQRLEHVFVSHTHIDHFIGFDYLLRLLVDAKRRSISMDLRASLLRSNTTAGYRWNLVDRFLCDLVFVVTEVDAALAMRTARFRLKTAFAAEDLAAAAAGWRSLSRAYFLVATAVLEHRTPCLAFAVAEAEHVNVWKNRLAELGLPVGPWLRALKRAVIEKQPDDTPIEIGARSFRSAHCAARSPSTRGRRSLT